MKKALVVGLGGIGKNVYVPQFEKLGFTVETVDINPAVGATYPTVNDVPKTEHYDMAVICLPNAHHLNAVLEVSDVCNKILVEKPGLANVKAWNNTIERFPNHYISMVKNNLYREEYIMLREACDLNTATKIEINWLNKSRIPNPGGWFTNKEIAFGGVTHDLFPHLYCFLCLLIPFTQIVDLIPKTFKMQRWNLTNIGTDTDYGDVALDGVYNVCDYAEAHYMVPRDYGQQPIPVTLRASWKEGYDDQSIRIYNEDGTVFHWEFGLCPDEVYGEMLKQVSERKSDSCRGCLLIDRWIHAQLEWFDDEN